MAHRRRRGGIAVRSLATLLTISWMAEVFMPLLVATRCPAKHPCCRQFRRISLTSLAKRSEELRGEGVQTPSACRATNGAGEMLLLVRGGWQGELYNLELSSALEAAGVRSAGGNLSLLGAGVWRLHWPAQASVAVQKAWDVLHRRRPVGLLAGPFQVLLGPAHSCRSLLEEAQGARGAEDGVTGAEILKKVEEGLVKRKKVKNLKNAKEVTWWMRLVQHHGSKTGTPPFLFDGEFPSFLARLGAILGAAGAKQAAAEEHADVRLVLLRLRLRSCDGLAWVRSQTGTDKQEEDSTTWVLAAALESEVRRSEWLKRWQHRPWTFTGAMEGQLASAAARIAILSHCARAQVKGAINVLDPCVGSGTLALAAAMEPEVSKVFCVDIRDFEEHLKANLQFANVPDIQKMTLLMPQDVSDRLTEAVLAATDIVLANPPWGKVCKTAEDGTAVMQSLISQLPWATFAFFVSAETLKEVEDLLDVHEQVTLGSSSRPGQFVVATVRDQHRSTERCKKPRLLLSSVRLSLLQQLMLPQRIVQCMEGCRSPCNFKPE
ncbi:unnamed protein product [Symbiodinium necroappetens]|uniref:Trimethylguanosine synthase n=1 Tax=Symbiodinium necroappetens TaxID=1628268 RepID=A0A813C5P5_9DINO|nr:unnamed protein product [Symbiodinium necroappetens]